MNKFLLTGILAALISLSAIRCSGPVEKKAESYASLSDSTGYVGINTCRECHSSIYDSFIRTGMGQSFAHASRQKSAALFNHQKPVYDSFKNLYYLAFWEKDSLKIREFRLLGKDTIHNRVETISYIVGSGQHTNSHIINTGGYLHQAPLTFYTQKKQWDLPPGFENGNNTRFNRMIGLECMTCHNSYPKFVKGSENKFEFVDNGINCERCHGPGEKHVSDKRAGKIVDITTQIDYSIVNPAKLAINLQFDICQRCHIQGNAVLNDGKSFFDFRPGMELSSVMNVFMPVFEGRENEHIMASHAERLKMSKCYIETMKHIGNEKVPALKPYRNALTCVTCHNPHVSVKETGNAVFNNACNNCHKPENSCTEKPEIRELSKNDCVSCHMKKSGATDIPHVSVHDHRIMIPVAAAADTGKRVFMGIACINNTNPPAVAKGRAFLNYFEKFNFGTEVLDSAHTYFPDATAAEIKMHFDDLVRLAYLENKPEKVIHYAESVPLNEQSDIQSYDNKDAWTAYRIAQSYQNSGNSDKSLQYFKKAWELAPMYSDFSNKYATALFNSGKPSEARAVLSAADKEYPENAAIASNLGYISLAYTRDTSGIAAYYDRALQLDPDYVQAMLNKTGLLIATGKTTEAGKLLKQILMKEPGNKQAQQLVTILAQKTK
ncbi:MAG TPA: tetratricopeptide repeat protein [Bacteroidia bacterium]|nr:tetratricopeptide repeat protein [Bacteroidia bacterium]